MMTKTDSKALINVIGFDPGFGNTKVCLGGQTSLLQSAVSLPRQVGLAAIGMQSASHGVMMVEINGRKYAVGIGASDKGELRTSMDYSALTSPERRALLYGTAAQALEAHGLREMEDALLVIGLPVPLLEDSEQAQAVLESLKSLKGEHVWSVNGGKREPREYCLTIDRLKVLAQPVGAYIDYAYDATLVQRPGVSKSEVLVLDVGMNTLDVYVIKGAKVMDRFIGGAEVGVKRLLELLATNGHDLMEIDADLRSGALKVDAAHLESYLGEVLAALKRTAPNLRRFDVVIPCGGGALVLGEKLRAALASKGATVCWPDDPVATNVRGFYKFGAKAAAA